MIEAWDISNTADLVVMSACVFVLGGMVACGLFWWLDRRGRDK